MKGVARASLLLVFAAICLHAEDAGDINTAFAALAKRTGPLLARANQIPSDIQARFAAEAGTNAFEMADASAYWSSRESHLPLRHLIFAICTADGCLIHYERGGYAGLTYHLVYIAHSIRGRTILKAGLTGTLSDLAQLAVACQQHKLIAVRGL